MKIGNPIVVLVCGAIAVSSMGYTAYTVWKGNLPKTAPIGMNATSGEGAGLVQGMNPPAGATDRLLASLDRDPFGNWQPPAQASNGLAPMMPDAGMVASTSSMGSSMGSSMSGSIQPPPVSVPPVRPMPPMASMSGNGATPETAMLPGVTPNAEGGTSTPATSAEAKLAEPTKVVLRALITASTTLAYIEIDGKPARAFKAGDAVLKGLKVQNVSKRSIVVLHDGEPTTLRVGQEFQIQ